MDDPEDRRPRSTPQAHKNNCCERDNRINLEEKENDGNCERHGYKQNPVQEPPMGNLGQRMCFSNIPSQCNSPMPLLQCAVGQTTALKEPTLRYSAARRLSSTDFVARFRRRMCEKPGPENISRYIEPVNVIRPRCALNTRWGLKVAPLELAPLLMPFSS